MHPQRSQRIDELFAAAIALDPRARREFVESSTSTDPEMRAELASLLEHHDAAAGFLSQALIEDDRPAPMPLPATPARIGSFAIECELGRGGMGVVYLAVQENPRRTVALKVIGPGIASARALRRFEHEAQVLARLQHPGIAQIFEAGTADYGAGPQPYFAMEYVRGPTLSQYVANNRLGTRERLSLLAQVCDALDHAHHRGVVHRDLKPSNILVDETAERAQIKVLDFGVARATDGDVRTTSLRTDVGQVIGTLPYMSPEQAGGDPGAIDHRSDVYSLGVLGYELLCGRLPLEVVGKPLHEAVRIVREDEPTPLSRAAPVLRGDVDTIFAHALEKDRERRYASAAELAADVRRYLSDRPIVARPASRMYVLSKFARRNKVLVGGVAAVFLALVVGITGTSWQARVAAAERDRADHEARRARAVADFQQAMLARAHPSLDGREVKLVDVLDAAAASLPGELAGDPQSEADVRALLGDTYTGLGMLEKAQVQLEAALPLYRVGDGEHDERTLIAQLALARIHSQFGEFEVAEPLLRGAFDLLVRFHGREHPTTIRAANDLAWLHSRRGESDEAMRIARENLELSRRVLGNDSEHTLSALITLGEFWMMQGALEQAAPLVHEAFERAPMIAGERDPTTLVAMADLAHLLRDQGRLDESEELFRNVVEISVADMGPEHPETINNMNNHASVLSLLGQSARAEELFRRVLDFDLRVFGEEHEATLGAMNNEASELTHLGRTAEAIALLRRRIEIDRRLNGDDARSVVLARYNLAKALLASGDAAAALPYFEDVVARSPNALPAGHWLLPTYHAGLGRCLRAMQRLDDAEREFAEALGGMRALFADDDERVQAIAQDMRDLCAGRGETDRAEELERQFSLTR